MKTGKILRSTSLVMLLTAAAFVFCAISNPALGTTFYIGSFVFGAEQWRFCYKIYAVIMASLFAISFFTKDKK